jgi:hypothetical protein
LDKNLDEKISLSCLQILKEVVVSGFHLPMIDNLFLTSILRVIQQPDSSLYGLAIDVLRQLIETSTYNTT